MSNDGLALFDVLLEVRKTGSKELLLLGREGTNGVDLLYTVDLFDNH